MTINERIKARRISLGLSATQVAEMIGKDRATVYRYESEYINDMPISVLEPLAIALRTSPAYLMGWTDDPSISPKTNDAEQLINLLQQLPDDLLHQVLDYTRWLISQHNQ